MEVETVAWREQSDAVPKVRQSRCVGGAGQALLSHLWRTRKVLTMTKRRKDMEAREALKSIIAEYGVIVADDVDDILDELEKLGFRIVQEPRR